MYRETLFRGREMQFRATCSKEEVLPMSFRKTLILFIILLLLGGYYYVVEVRMAANQQAAEEAEKQLFPISSGDIATLILQRADEPETVLEKQEQGWQITRPVTAAPDAPVVANVVRAFVEAERDKTIGEAADDPAEFGLETPQLTLIAVAPGAEQEWWLNIGGKTPTASGYYASAGDNQAVITISTDLKNTLDKSLYDLRDKTILAFEPAQLTGAEFRIRSPQNGLARQIRLEQRDDQWHLTAPIEDEAATETVNALLSKLKSAQIQEFVAEHSDDLAQYGLDRSAVTLSLSMAEDAAPNTLLLGDPNEAKSGVYAKHASADPVFLIPTEVVEEFPEQADDLRDRTLLAFHNDDVQKLEVRSAESALVIEPVAPQASDDAADAPTTWRISEPVETPADAVKVRDLLAQLRDMQVEHFVTDDAAADVNLYGLEPPQIALRVWLEGQDAPQELFLGNPDVEHTGVYAKLADDDSIVLVQPEALDQFTLTAFDLRDRRILDFAIPRVSRIQLRYPDATLALEKRDEQWMATAPEERELDPYQVNNLLYALSDLEFSEEIPQPGDLAEYGLSEPELTLTLSDADGQELTTLLVGQAVAEHAQRYVTTGASETVYAIDPGLLDELPTEIGALTATD
jgi:hypothetical protein